MKLQILLIFSIQLRSSVSFSASPNNPMFLSSTNYLNSLSNTERVGVEEEHEGIPEYRTEAFMTSTENVMETYEQQIEQQQNRSHQEVTFDSALAATAAITPDDHYAKDHPGAGWAGYKHPQFGGYLDNLNENTFEEGKKADYGDDIRWGAQVYLDRLEGDTH